MNASRAMVYFWNMTRCHHKIYGCFVMRLPFPFFKFLSDVVNVQLHISTLNVSN